LRKAREYALIILFNVLAIFGILYAVEYLFSPYKGLPRNDQSSDTQYSWGRLVELNRFGFRERDFETPKAPNTFRIMVLGDSFTWGEGLAYEERFTYLAEELLNDASTGQRFEVLSFGTRGASTDQQRKILKNHIKEVEPDLIVVAFTLNDTQPREQDYSQERELFNRRGGFLVIKLTDWMHDIGLRYIAKSMYSAFYSTVERAGLIPDWETSMDRTYDKSSDEWKLFLRALDAIHMNSSRFELPGPLFIVLNQGTSTTEPTDYANPDKTLGQYLEWYHQAEAAAQEAGYLTYNHEEEIAAQLSDEPLSINRVDGHPSAKLNQIYGEKLFLMVTILLDGGP